VKTKTITWIGILSLGFGAGVLVVPHREWSYSGPGTMRDDGILSYPRYRLELPRVGVVESLQRFTFTGVPSQEMSVQLYLPGFTMEDIEQLRRVHLRITTRLFEEATAASPRRLLCSATGTPDGMAMDSRWVVTGSYDSAALWHSHCLRVPMSDRRQYTLILEIVDSNLSGIVKVLVPALQGGGFELP
jgi:hypothetical protein